MNTPENYYNCYYLLDASAYCRFADKRIKSISHHIISNYLKGCFYYIPQFCIAEVFNTFAKWYYAEKNINQGEYKSFCDIFKTLIRNRNVLYPYDLHRYHNLNCDLIYEKEHTTSAQKKGKLSTFDILIIAMAIELQKIHGSKNLTLLSCDDRLIQIASLLNIKTELYK